MTDEATKDETPVEAAPAATGEAPAQAAETPDQLAARGLTPTGSLLNTTPREAM